MSERGRGRGRSRGSGGGGRGDYGRGPPRRDQPPPSHSSGRGSAQPPPSQSSGRGRAQPPPSQSSSRGSAQPPPSQSSVRGHGRGGYGDYQAPMPQPPPPESSEFPALSAPTPPSPLASSSAASLSRDLQHKLALQPPAPAPAPAPAQPAVPVQVSPVVQSPLPTSVQTPPPSSSKALRPPARPGFGIVGQKCVVRANHFLVGVAEQDLHHYDVSIAPEVTSKKLCRQIINQLVESYRLSHLGKLQLAYDGSKSAYTAGPLPFSSKEFVVKLVDQHNGARKERDFKVSIKFAAKPDMHHLQQFLQGRQLDTPQETIQVLDVVLRATPSMNYAVVGRSFFSPKFGVGDLGDGLQYWKGFYQSLRPTQIGLSLNIDMSAKAFYEPILVTDFVAKYFNVHDLDMTLSDRVRVKVKRAIKGLKVELTHMEYVRHSKISGLSPQPTNELRFSLDDTGAKITVDQYFRQKYNITLKYPFLNALVAGSDAKPVYLPMEICKIVEGQRYTKKLNERQVTALLRATCQRPDDREKSIKKMVAGNNYNNDSLVNQEFRIHVRAELASVHARVLPSPTLKYHQTGEKTLADPSVGQWNMIDKKLYTGGKVEFWTCISFSQAGGNWKQFCHNLVSMCRSKGMVFNESLLPVKEAHPGEIEKALCDIHAQSIAKLASMKQMGKQLQLLIVILPDASGSYGKIKRVCETELGIVSQCCQPTQARKYNKQYLENVVLKINVKVGGRNTVLMNAVDNRIPIVTDRRDHFTIIFGADVTHSSPGDDSSPSVAAVVASMDWPEITTYRALVSAQEHKQEIIQDLYKTYQDPQRGIVHGGMIRELLLAFYRSTKQKPKHIIFYRDGVSEGQFNQVLLYEMDAIRKACLSLEENYLPLVTFVVVQKRHHTRLFPNRGLTDKSGNILPGTVVDTDICHPNEFDFYLCSHAGNKGTSRPTHYHVLFDENNFSADDLQTLTNSLCYTYARCTRSVSIVPPAYYAHLAAFRARYYIEGETSESESISGRATTRERSEVRSLPVIKESVKGVMFYV